jgi:hypothetical protein
VITGYKRLLIMWRSRSRRFVLVHRAIISKMEYGAESAEYANMVRIPYKSAV